MKDRDERRTHRRIDIAEIPLVGRDLAVRVEVVVAQHQIELGPGEIVVDDGERQYVEGQVPGREPRQVCTNSYTKPES